MLIGRFAIFFLSAFLHPPDDYYSSRNGKYLGTDGNQSGTLRLIDEQRFAAVEHRFPGLQQAEADAALRAASQLIVIDNERIQRDLQAVRDLSMSGKEYELYIILDQRAARITSIMSGPGTNGASYFEYFPAPGLGANMPVGPDQHRMVFKIILGQVHGHPDSERPFLTTFSGMSPDMDAVVARHRQVPIYGVDAMTNTGLPGSAGHIHRANPDGTIDNNIGWTIGNGEPTFDIGRDALERWGRSGVPSLD